MSAVKRVLCPVDFDERSGRAVARAQDIALRHGAELQLLHVLPRRPESLLMPRPAAAEQVDRAARGHLGELAKMIRDGGVSCEVSIAYGDAALHILEAARDAAVDLIVMATHGRQGVARVALGSVTEAVLHATPCPLLTIPPRSPAAGGPFRRVVCAVDCSPTSPATLAQAVAIADEAHGELTVVNVVDIAFSTVPPEVVRASAEKALADLHHDPAGQIAHRCQIQDVVRFGDAATEVLKVAGGLDAQLIVVGARSRRPAVAAMMGSAADRIVRDSPCPVLAVPSAPVSLAVPALQPVYA